MINSETRPAHTFHIPVMGTGFTIDTPLRVAKYGIASVISLGDDILVEQMRKFHCDRLGEPYTEIKLSDPDARARRITTYLDFIDRLVAADVKALQASPFEPGSEITRYFELLPDTPLSQSYEAMLALEEGDEKQRQQQALRQQAVPGSIDANIMAKSDRELFKNGKPLAPEFNTAMSGLRGYANSTLQSSMIMSAGMNPRLYGYMGQFPDFFPDETGLLRKKIILKVGDFRSAFIQGKFLAKRGLWVSEYRIESGLNCGGHAFATKGYLMGPILEEFKKKRADLTEGLHRFYEKGLAACKRPPITTPHDVRITAQGGIGTAGEDSFLLASYELDGTGWATPFMLVPEVVNVDDNHLNKLQEASDDDVFLSDASPLGIPFWNLRASFSETARRNRIDAENPGSPCPKGYLMFSTEYTEIAICTASRNYQHRKLTELQETTMPGEQRDMVEKNVLAKSCICHDLAGGVTLMHGIDPKATPAYCCGPNIANFSKIATLEEMVAHIYGKFSLPINPDRSHMFINELKISMDHLRSEVAKSAQELSPRLQKYYQEVRENLMSGIEYYRDLADKFHEEQKGRFLDQLNALREQLAGMSLVGAVPMAAN